MVNIRGYSNKAFCISLLVIGTLISFPMDVYDEPNPLLGTMKTPILGIHFPFSKDLTNETAPESEETPAEVTLSPEPPPEPERAQIEPEPKEEFIWIEATAYSLRGKMFNGKEVHQGAISVDPKVIPLGTKGYIEGIGEVIAEDTGGAIKGNIVDIWMPTTDQALKWGRRKVKLWIRN